MLEDGIKVDGSSEPAPIMTEDTPPWIKEGSLKITCNTLVKQLIEIRKRVRGYKSEYDRKVYQELTTEINAEFMVDGTPQPEMSVSQLNRKVELLREAIRREQPSDDI